MTSLHCVSNRKFLVKVRRNLPLAIKEDIIVTACRCITRRHPTPDRYPVHPIQVGRYDVGGWLPLIEVPPTLVSYLTLPQLSPSSRSAVNDRSRLTASRALHQCATSLSHEMTTMIITAATGELVAAGFSDDRT